MKSPFPGMDPYLEQHWRDVHASLIIYSRDRIQEQLPGGLRCRVEERVVLERDGDTPERSMFPDVRVIERPHANGGGQAVAVESGVAVAEPLVVHAADEDQTETFLEIIDVGTGNRVITVIEVLSLSNKLPGEAHDKYVQKRKELRQARVSLVEIDLLREGHHPVAFWRLPAAYRTHYQVAVRRGWRSRTGQCDGQFSLLAFTLAIFACHAMRK